MKRIVLFLYIVLTLVIAACKRESPTSWNTSLIAPIAKGRITLEDIVPDSILQADENSLWHLVLNENLTDFDLDSLVAIPDTVIKKKFTVPLSGGPYIMPNGTDIINQHDNNLLNVSDAELREVRIKSGLLEYSIKSYINGYLSCTYTIPGVTLNGVGTVIQTTTEPKQGSQPFVYSGSIDLAGYKMNLTGQSGFMSNRIYTHLNIKTDLNAPTQAQIYGQDSVVVELRFVEPKVEYAKGYFGQHIYQLNQTVDFASGLNFPTGALNIDQATMEMNIENSVGVDAQIKFETVSNYNAINQTTVNLNHSPLFQPINITRASDNNGNIQSNSYHYSLNNGNSNIDQFIENLPVSLNLAAQVKVNPLGNVTDGNDFIYTANSLNADIKLDVPLAIGMQNLAFADTLSITSNTEISADGKIYLYVKNAFPFSATCDVKLINASNETTNILLGNGVINYAMETGNPGVTIPVESVIVIPITREALQNFNSEHRIALRILLNTPSFENHSRLYKGYYMDFKIIADAEAEVSYE